MVRIPHGTLDRSTVVDEVAPPRRGRPFSAGPFDLDRTEVTVATYRACVRTGACTYVERADADPLCNWNPRRVGRKHVDDATHPMNCVTHAEATACCRHLGKRLPTRNEWELAARGLEGRVLPWGGIDSVPRGGWLAWGCFSHPGPCSAGSVKAPGALPFDLHDMAGNVAEWAGDAVADHPDLDDAMAKRRREPRLVCGTSYRDPDVHDVTLLALANTRAVEGLERFPAVGFRCAADVGTSDTVREAR